MPERRNQHFKRIPREVNFALKEILDKPLGEVSTFGPMTKAEAWRFRQQLYGWRHSFLTQLNDPTRPDTLEGQTWCETAIHPRCTIEWIELTEFKARKKTDEIQLADPWFIDARVRKPLAGPPPRDPLAVRSAERGGESSASNMGEPM